MRWPLVFLQVVFSLVLALSALAQQPGMVINVAGAGSSADANAGLINGYKSSVSGQVMQYHSAHPDAEMALIVRAQRDVHSIAWETDPLPSTYVGDFYRLVWLAGLEHAGWVQEKTPHTFHFLINGQQYFTFQNSKDESAKDWTTAGQDGAELHFRSTKADVFGDLFGYMFLKLPKKDFPPGQSLRLEVIGEDADSPDWYMTFQHRFESVPRLRTEPALLRGHGGPTQVLRVSLDNLAAGRTIEISLPNEEPIHSALNIGGNIFQVPVPAVSSDTPLAVTFQMDGKTVNQSTVTLKPVRRRDIYLLSYSHNDIGYTDLQADVEKKQWRNLELGLDLIRRTRDYPPEARFKWNMEVIWALDTYMQHASPERRQEIVAAIRDGSLGVNALYANMLTGLANATEMEHFLDYARFLHADYGIAVTSALTSDVPGFTWGIVSALAHSGVKYFAMAPNNGDRIGHTIEAWGDKPFYWVSQSGQEKVLAWVAGASYSSFHEGTLSKLGDEKVLKLMRHLDETGYPYDIVHMPYTQGDNGPPDPTLPDFVRSWNERYASPRLVLATHAQMFEEFEKRYGTQLPLVRGDFTPYWEDGAASTAYETALNRQAVDRLIQSQTLWSILSPGAFPSASYASAWRNAILWDEHTWGADKSVSDPDLPFVTSQWATKKEFAEKADALSRELMKKVLKPATASAASAVDIYNTSSWERTDLVLLPPGLSAAGDRVVDAAGKPVRSQRLSTGELAVLAENVPPLSARRYVITAGKASDAGSAVAKGNTLHDDVLWLAVSRQTGGMESLRWKGSPDELVGSAAGLRANQYEYVSGRDATEAKTLSNVTVTVKESGGLVASLLVKGDAPGSKSFASEIRLIDGLGRVDIINEIDKKKVREKEGVHFAFPFHVRDGLVRYDVASSVVRAEADQLTGSCKNYVSAQSWVDVSNGEYGISLALPDAPLVEIGGINAEQGWMTTTPRSQVVFSYVMNNYWHTNYKADQEGPVRFRYALAPHASFKPEIAARFGQEQRQPLLAVAADPSVARAAPFLEVNSASVNLVSMKPLGASAWLLYLYNASGDTQSPRLRWRKKLPLTMRTSDATGAAGHVLKDAFAIAPYGTVYVRVDGKR